jgi:hypothetical protein
VPDDKIPSGKGVRILCPKCKMPIDLKETPPPAEPPGKAGTTSPYPGKELDHMQEETSLLDMVEEGVKTAILCVSEPGRAEKVRNVIAQMGFYAVVAPKASFAIKKFQNNTYDLVVLDELFDATKLSDNLVIHHIQLLPMHVRRKFFLCLLSETLPTMDQMVAFRMGVDLIYNPQDLEKIKIVLLRAMKDHESLYKVFSEELSRKGQP